MTVMERLAKSVVVPVVVLEKVEDAIPLANAMAAGGVTASGAMVAVVSRLPATTFNMAVAIIIAPILSTAIRKALTLNHITLN